MRVVLACKDAERADWLAHVLGEAGFSVVVLTDVTPTSPELKGAELLHHRRRVGHEARGGRSDPAMLLSSRGATVDLAVIEGRSPTSSHCRRRRRRSSHASVTRWMSPGGIGGCPPEDVVRVLVLFGGRSGSTRSPCYRHDPSSTHWPARTHDHPGRDHARRTLGEDDTPRRRPRDGRRPVRPAPDAAVAEERRRRVPGYARTVRRGRRAAGALRARPSSRTSDRGIEGSAIGLNKWVQRRLFADAGPGRRRLVPSRATRGSRTRRAGRRRSPSVSDSHASPSQHTSARASASRA